MTLGMQLVPRAPGVYALVIELCRDFSGYVGSLGRVTLARGIYVYVGSARGPGGLYSRIRRHEES